MSTTVEPAKTWATLQEEAARGALRGALGSTRPVIVTPGSVTIHVRSRAEAETVIALLRGRGSRRPGEGAAAAALAVLADHEGTKIPKTGSPAWSKLAAELTERLA